MTSGCEVILYRWGGSVEDYLVKVSAGSRAMDDDLPLALPESFHFSQLTALGVSQSRLRHWLEKGLVERVGRGSYLRADAMSVDPDRLEVALRAPRATICLTSGLVEHDLVDDNPGALDLALPRGLWQPHLTAPVRWHSFAVATFDLDRTVVPIDGRPGSRTGNPAAGDQSGTHEVSGGAVIGLYGPRRCIVDAFRLRHEVGPEVGVEALRRWLRWPGSNPRELLGLANDFPASLPALTAALQALL